MPTRELERRAKEILSELVQLESAQTRARLLGKRCGSDEQLRETVISLCRDENLIRELTDWLPPVPPKQLMSIETLDSEIDSIVTSNAEADAAAHAHVQTQDQDSDDSSDTPTSWEFPSGIVTSVPASPVSTGSHSHGPLFPSVAVSRYDRFEIRGTPCFCDNPR